MNCANDIIYVKNSFLFFNSKEKYKESQRICEKHNTTLLPLKSKETMRHVSQLLENKNCPSKWRIGLNFDRETKKGRYSDNNFYYPQYHIKSLSYFKQNERETKCQSTFIERGKKNLFRYKCSEPLPFVCFNPRFKNIIQSNLNFTQDKFVENSSFTMFNHSKNESKDYFTKVLKNIQPNYPRVSKSKGITTKPIILAAFSGASVFGCIMLLFLILFIYRSRKSKKRNKTNKNIYFSYNTSQNGQSYEETEVRCENLYTKVNKEKSTKTTAM